MDIEQSSDQHSTREVTSNTVEATNLMVSALDALFEKLGQMGLEYENQVTILVGSKKVYQGSLDGEGDRRELTETQAKTLRGALAPENGSGSVRILDSERNLLFQSKGGEILKNELHLLQKQSEAEAVTTEPVISKPDDKVEAVTPESVASKSDTKVDDANPLETTSSTLEFSQGQIPEDLGIPQLQGVDPNRLAEVDRNLAISWGVALEKVAAINESRVSVGDNNPAMSQEYEKLMEARASMQEQIKDKGYTREQLLGEPSQEISSPDNSQRSDIPSLDEAAFQDSENPPLDFFQSTSLPVDESGEPIPWDPSMVDDHRSQWSQNRQYMDYDETPSEAASESVQQESEYVSPVDSVLESVDNAPGIPQAVSDPIAQQNEINQENPQPQESQEKLGDPLEELGHIAINQAEQIAELQAKLTEVSGKLDELTDWKESITPVKLANNRVEDWMNSQRDKVASKIHSFANRIAASAAQKFDEVQEQVKEQVDQGVERHQQAVNEVKTQVTEKVGQVRDSVQQQVSEGQNRHKQALGERGQQAAELFMNRFVDPAVKTLVSQMEKVDATSVHADGTKSFETSAISWNVKPDGSTSLTRKADGQAITPQTATMMDMEAMQAMVTKVDQKYGLGQSQSQSQTQSPSHSPTPAPAVSKVMQKV